MPSRVVGLPRSQAIRLAEYEREALALRAQSSRRCPDLWRQAARQADLVAQHLAAGRDKAAMRAARGVGPAWKRAADCEGWRTPLGLTETEESKLDIVLANQAEQARKRRLALILGGVGAIIAAARLGIVAIPVIKAAKARKS